MLKDEFYIISIVAKADEYNINIQEIIVDKELKECCTDLSPTYMVAMYEARLNKFKEEKKHFNDLLEEAYIDVRSGSILVSEVKEHIRGFSANLLNLPADCILNYTLNTDKLGLNLVAEMGIYYAEKLDEESLEFLYYCSSIANYLIESNTIHDQIRRVYENKDLFDQDILLNINSIPIIGIIERREMKINCIDLIEISLTDRLFHINDDFKEKKSELEKLLNHQ